MRIYKKKIDKNSSQTENWHQHLLVTLHIIVRPTAKRAAIVDGFATENKDFVFKKNC